MAPAKCYARAVSQVSERDGGKVVVNGKTLRLMVCQVCGRDFPAKRSDATTCSAACRQKRHRRDATVTSIGRSDDSAAALRAFTARRRVEELPDDERKLLDMWHELKEEYELPPRAIDIARRAVVNRVKRIEREQKAELGRQHS